MGVGVYIPNMSKPKDCSECILADKHLNGLYEAKYYCRLEADSCTLIEINEEVIKSITSLEAVRKAMEKGGA